MNIACKLCLFSLVAVLTLLLHVRFQVELVIGLCLLVLSYLALMFTAPSALREIWRVVNDD